MGSKNDLTPTFFCVPDITGFTRFVATADINFAREVIPALLRKLIDANILGMSVAEIEGDAIFFYKTGRLPSIARVAKQCELFFNIFFDFLESLKESPSENHSDELTEHLGLKVIIHHGLVGTANIKGRTKLIGEDVIIAHKLLKNSVAEDNYILLTEKYLNKIKGVERVTKHFNNKSLLEGKEEYEYIGVIPFSYIPLERKTQLAQVLLKP